MSLSVFFPAQDMIFTVLQFSNTSQKLTKSSVEQWPVLGEMRGYIVGAAL